MWLTLVPHESTQLAVLVYSYPDPGSGLGRLTQPAAAGGDHFIGALSTTTTPTLSLPPHCAPLPWQSPEATPLATAAVCDGLRHCCCCWCVPTVPRRRRCCAAAARCVRVCVSKLVSFKKKLPSFIDVIRCNRIRKPCPRLLVLFVIYVVLDSPMLDSREAAMIRLTMPTGASDA